MQVEPKNTKGIFVISLDFELYWGMIDKIALDAYRARLDGERHESIPRALALFDRYGIHATWATVGMLACKSRSELVSALPTVQPHYRDTRLSTYEHIRQGKVGEDEAADPYHFGASLLNEIKKHAGQEIGSHTFSHYYCAEEGQDLETFRADLAAARVALARFGSKAETLVLPRNQWQEGYAEAAWGEGIRAYRGNQPHFLYAPRKDRDQNLFIRAVRLLDHYLPLSGDHVYSLKELKKSRPVDVPASVFLRPYARALRMFEGLRRSRITRGMTKAAKQGKLFHLWWHPYNMGLDVEENFATLEHILKHYAKLREAYGMQSMNMVEVADHLGV